MKGKEARNSPYDRCTCGHTARSHLYSGVPEVGGRCVLTKCGCQKFEQATTEGKRKAR